MRVVFMGTPNFAVPTLLELVNNSKHHVIQVVTSIDKPSGRGRNILPTPVKSSALSLNLPIIQPHNLSDDNFLGEIRALDPDVFVIVAFRILPEVLFSIPRYGAINLHASLLPKYRGAAPIPWALINGEKVTGVTTFQIDAGIDTGGILLQEEVVILPEETAGELSLRLAVVGAKLIVRTLNDLEAGTLTEKQQPSVESSRAPKIIPEMLPIDWNKTAQEIVNIIRGLSPVPGAFTSYKKIRLKVFHARVFEKGDEKGVPGSILTANPKDGLLINAGSGTVQIVSVQREGKKQMPASDLLRGMHMAEGDILT